MVAQQNFTWEQGEDFTLSITYTVDGASGVTGTTEVRMDIASAVSPGDPLYTSFFTFNTDDADAETEDEITVDEGTGEISITVPRSLTLAGGAIYDKLSSGQTTYKYDLFVRTDGLQKKILQGQITVNKSVTQWA